MGCIASTALFDAKTECQAQNTTGPLALKGVKLSNGETTKPVSTEQ